MNPVCSSLLHKLMFLRQAGIKTKGLEQWELKKKSAFKGQLFQKHHEMFKLSSNLAANSCFNKCKGFGDILPFLC